MMPARDLTRESPFGRLTVLERIGSRGKHALWRCRCECGAIVEALSNHLLVGNVRSCGCLVTDTNGRPERGRRNAAIRQARQQGKSYASIAVQFGLSPEYVRRVCNGEGA
jgi:hypothetical protein